MRRLLVRRRGLAIALAPRLAFGQQGDHPRQPGNLAPLPCDLIRQVIEMAKGSYTRDVMADVRVIAEAHPGSAPLEFSWSDGNGSPARFRSRSLTLAADGAALSALRNILGESSVRLQRGS